MNNKIIIFSTIILTLFIISINMYNKNNNQNLLENFENSDSCTSNINGGLCTLPLVSSGGQFKLNVTNDGKLYIESDGERVWEAKPINASDIGADKAPYKLYMQNDGNVVLYNKDNKAVFSANTVTNENSPFKLIMQSDRNLVSYNKNNNPLWNTQTNIIKYKNEDWDSLNPPKDKDTLFLSFIADDTLEVYHNPGNKYPIGYRNLARKNLKNASEDAPTLIGKVKCCNNVVNMSIPNFRNGDSVLLYLLNGGGPSNFAGHAYWNGTFYPTNASDYKVKSVETKVQGKGINGYVVAGENIGCFKDQCSTARSLPSLLGVNKSQEECRDLALSSGNQYYGLQFGGECWAGNDFNRATQLGKAKCSMPGKKDNRVAWTQILGDSCVNDIYNTTNAPKTRELGSSGHGKLHPEAKLINPKEGPDGHNSLDYWIEFEFKPVKPSKEVNINDIGVKSLCDPSLENTQGKVKNPFCNFNMTDDELNKMTFLAVNTNNDFVTKSFKMGDKNTLNTYMYSRDEKDKTTKFSYSFWIKIKQLKPYWRGIFRQGTTSDGFRLPGCWIYPDQTAIHFRVSTINNWNDGLDIQTGEIAINRWYNIVYTVSNNVVKCYINGVFYGRRRFDSKVLDFKLEDSSLYINNYDNARDGSVEIAKLRVFPMEIEKDFIGLILLSEVPTDNKNYYECMTKNNKISRQEAHLQCYDLIFNDTQTVKDNGRLLELKNQSLYDTSPLNGITRPPSFKIINGICYLSGCIYAPNNGSIAYLPRDARPEKRLVFYTGNTKESRVDIFDSGKIAMYGTSDGVITLDTIHFPLSFKGKPIEFTKSKASKYVKISLSTGQPLSVAEVEVYSTENGEQNLALGKRVSTSSLAANGTPDRAVDGNKNGNYNNNSVTHTDAGSTQFLLVDLDGYYNISKVKIYNRTDCCGDRIYNARISLLDDNMNEINYAIWTPESTPSSVRDFSFTSDNTTPISTGWTNYGTDYRNAGYTIVKNMVYLSGLVRIATGKVKLNSIIGKVGADAAPKELRICTSLVNDDNTCRIDITKQGYIILRDFNQSKSAWDWVSLDSVSYSIENYPNLPLRGLNPYSIKNITPIQSISKFNSYTQKPLLIDDNNFSLLGNMTISFWVNCEQNWRQNPFWKGYAGDGAVTIEENGLISYYFGPAGENGYPYEGFSSYPTTIKFKEWNHVAITRDIVNKKINIFINGSKVSSTATNITAIGKTASKAKIGAGYVNDLKGYLKDMMIYDTALTSNHINYLYNIGNGTLTTNYTTAFITQIEETVYFGGLLEIPNTPGRQGIALLDEKYRPNRQLVFIVNQNSNIGKLVLSPDGWLTLEFAEPSVGFISLDGICYNPNKN